MLFCREVPYEGALAGPRLMGGWAKVCAGLAPMESYSKAAPLIPNMFRVGYPEAAGAPDTKFCGIEYPGCCMWKLGPDIGWKLESNELNGRD